VRERLIDPLWMERPITDAMPDTGPGMVPPPFSGHLVNNKLTAKKWAFLPRPVHDFLTRWLRISKNPKRRLQAANHSFRTNPPIQISICLPTNLHKLLTGFSH
jgi:hypothetical protein